MRKAGLAASAAIAGAYALIAGVALAQAQPPSPTDTQADGDLYVINASGRPMRVIIDQARPAELPRLATARQPLAAGGHGVAVIQDGRVISAWQAFDTTNVTLNVKGRPAWCYLAERSGAAGGVRLHLLPPGDCREMISAGPAEDMAGVAAPRAKAP